MLVHFPIALLICALIADLLLILTGRAWFDGACHFCILGGAAGAVVTTVLGWLAGRFEGYSGDQLEFHFWLGIATACLAVIVAALDEYRRQKCARRMRWIVRVLLVTTAVTVALTGYSGGVIVYGAEHWNW